MSIRRKARPDENFYVLDKRISEDSRLGWAARGLLIYLLGKPDNWEISTQNLVNQTEFSDSRSGRDAVYGLIKQLVNAGYITRVQGHQSGGKFGAVEYEVSEISNKSSPLTDLPYTVEPLPANPTLIRTDNKQELKETSGDTSLKEKKAPRRFENTGIKTIPTEWKSYAESKGFGSAQISTEFEKFGNYWEAKSGPSAVKLDWLATWRNWIISSSERNPQALKAVPVPTIHTAEWSESRWKNALDLAVEAGRWEPKWGPPPNDPATLCPPLLRHLWSAAV